ncbi:MAG: glutamate-cysteine ligase family protein [Longimicrobiales bacterium]
MSPDRRARDARAAQWVRENLFLQEGLREPRIGAELELLAVDADSGAVSRLDGRLGTWLSSVAETNGWRSEDSTKGAPKYFLPNGAAVTLEPGGQVEYSSTPHNSTASLISDLQQSAALLLETAAAHGITLAAVGIDPRHALDEVPLQLTGGRYSRMDRYFRTIGEAGPRMMRQTASLQINIDPAYDPLMTWSVLNRAAPVLTAMFANSREYAGKDTGCASYRALTWCELDPDRTGVFDGSGDPALEYAEFALNAPLIGDAAPYSRFRDDPRAGDEDLWEYHVSTLFPEVRPKGYYELRCIDAVPLESIEDPITLIAALVWNEGALRDADALLPPADRDALVRAARFGLDDQTLKELATGLERIASSTGDGMYVARKQLHPQRSYSG